MRPHERKVVGITGAGGLLGSHAAAWLHATTPFEIVTAARSTFADPDALDTFVRDCSHVIHFAGANRGADEDIVATNLMLAHRLIESCRRTGSRPHIVFANSVQAGTDSAYGRSKAQCAQAFMIWANGEGGGFTDLILPHVFGEHGRPFHNSVVSTFCFILAKGDQPRIASNGQLELMHALDVAAEISAIINRSPTSPTREGVTIRLHGKPMTVAEMLDRVRALAAEYDQGVIPDLRDGFDLRLFNTYRSYLYPQRYPRALQSFADNRGRLFELVKERSGGQVFVSATRPGQVRGNHFHFFKFERFLVIGGDAEIRVRRLRDAHVQCFRVSGESPAFVDIPTLHTHAIVNRGSTDLLTLFWTNEMYDPRRPDTYPEEV